MKKLRPGQFISIFLFIFAIGLLQPSCTASRSSMTEDASRKALMMKESSDRYKGKKVHRAKASRKYKRSKKRSNMYKNKKHKYR